jgi:hypothetical protein
MPRIDKRRLGRIEAALETIATKIAPQAAPVSQADLAEFFRFRAQAAREAAAEPAMDANRALAEFESFARRASLRLRPERGY